MQQSYDLAVTLRVSDLQRSRALYRRLGFVETEGEEAHACRLRRGGVELIVTDQPAPGADPRRNVLSADGPRGGGVVLTIISGEIDEVLGYWHEEGMLVISPLRRGRTGAAAFHGLDHDGYELRIEQPGTP